MNRPSSQMRRARTHKLFIVLLLLLAPGFVVFAQSADKSAEPTVDQVIERYIAAIGGKAAIQKQTTRASMGSIDIPSMHLSGTVMIHEKAPNKVLQVVIISGNAFRQGFDGTTGWTDDPATGMRVLSGVELSEVRRDGDMLHALHLKQIYPTLVFKDKEDLDGRAVYVLQGTPSGADEPDRLYFDAETGLAVRAVNYRHSADGYSEIREDFHDFREVEGMKLPFTIVQSGGSADFTIRIGEAHAGVNLEDSEFAPPKSAP